MRIEGVRAFVTGADGGIGSHICTQLLERGAAHVYEGVFGLEQPFTDGKRTRVGIDVARLDSVETAALAARDVTLVINCAGIYSGAATDPARQIELVQQEIDVNALGPLRVARAFGPALVAAGAARIVNLLSVTAWVTHPAHAGYAASKAAAWSLTNALRLEYQPRGVGVTGVILGYTDTPMTAHVDGPKNTASDVAATILDGIAEDHDEILCDDRSRDIKSKLSDDIGLIYRPILEVHA